MKKHGTDIFGQQKNSVHGSDNVPFEIMKYLNRKAKYSINDTDK